MNSPQVQFRSKSISPITKDSDWSISENESWAILGESDLYRDAFSQWLQQASCVKINTDPASSQNTSEDLRCAIVDFKSEENLILEEKRNDDSEFTEGGFDPGTLVEKYLNLKDDGSESGLTTKDEHLASLISAFSIPKLKKTGLRFLSNGEIKKVLIIKALQEHPHVFILENPFDGLDVDSCQQLDKTLKYYSNHLTLILLLSQRKSLPHWIQKVLQVTNSGESRVCTPKELSTNEPADITSDPALAMDHLLSERSNDQLETLIELKDIHISFNSRPLFEHFSWKIKLGEHWRLCGPNGAGKTTLLKIINADLPKSYGQNIRLFGYQRGQGESIWDIRENIGFLGTDSQRQFPKDMTGLAAVCSGLHHTFGIYKKPSPTEIQQSRSWIQHFELEHLSKKILSEMNYAETRMILILRAMIQCPKLLILDEPCQGLNTKQQLQVLSFVDQLLERSSTQLLYVTHDAQDQLNAITHQLKLQPDDAGISRALFTKP